MTCPRCGTLLEVGRWPFCPHGIPYGSVIRDEIPGGQVIENLDHTPMTFYSQKAIRDAADARGLRLTDKWAGPSDQFLSNWGAAIDAQTLENARILLTRGTRPLPVRDTRGDLTITTSIRPIAKWSEIE